MRFARPLTILDHMNCTHILDQYQRKQLWIGKKMKSL